jgi:hypothetical protein
MALFLVKSIDDRPKVVGAIGFCWNSPRWARPESESGANQRDANYN